MPQFTLYDKELAKIAASSLLPPREAEKMTVIKEMLPQANDNALNIP
jgi:hypothetical protein